MKTEIKYICEICGGKYANAQEAVDCELKGKANTKELPVGLIFPYAHNGFVGVFAVAKNEVSQYNKHFINETMWACRVTKGFGDSLDNQMCGNGGYLTKDTVMYRTHKDKENVGWEIRPNIPG